MKRLNKDIFIESARKVHGDKYDYSNVDYVNCKTKICIICPEHGEFWQTPTNHLSGQGCPKCANLDRIKSKSLKFEEFIEKARKIHGDKYDYSKVIYKNYSTKVCIICPIHGDFWQTPNNHLTGYGCKKCANDELSIAKRWSVEEFIEKAKKVHGDKYDYSKVEYVNSQTKVHIICPRHGDFWQTPYKHLIGEGCPFCKESSLEKEIRIFLTENGIRFDYNKRKKWLGVQRLDFYLPDYNVAIECQGIQHFEPVDFAGRGYEDSVKEYLKRKKMDLMKRKKCFEQGVKIFYYSNEKKEENIITDKNELLLKIFNKNP